MHALDEDYRLQRSRTARHCRVIQLKILGSGQTRKWLQAKPRGLVSGRLRVLKRCEVFISAPRIFLMLIDVLIASFLPGIARKSPVADSDSSLSTLKIRWRAQGEIWLTKTR